MTTEEMIIIDSVATPEWSAYLQSRPKPYMLLGVQTPQSLDHLTYGQLIELQRISNDAREAFPTICRVVLGVDDTDKVMQCEAEAMAGFFYWVVGEVKRIDKLFEEAQRKPTADEIAAGILDKRQSPIRMLDWYARRMGITSHDAVLDVKWLIIYECFANDNDDDAYQRRYSEVIANKHKRHK